MKKYMIYAAVCAAMLGSIVVAGFFGPLLVGIGLECAAKRYEKKTIY